MSSSDAVEPAPTVDDAVEAVPAADDAATGTTGGAATAMRYSERQVRAIERHVSVASDADALAALKLPILFKKRADGMYDKYKYKPDTIASQWRDPDQMVKDDTTGKVPRKPNLFGTGQAMAFKDPGGLMSDGGPNPSTREYLRRKLSVMVARWVLGWCAR